MVVMGIGGLIDILYIEFMDVVNNVIDNFLWLKIL